MKNLKIKNIKGHPSQSLAKANASRDLQINFNQAEDALTIPAESRHDYKCGFATQSGRSMIEMLGVLAIIGVLSVGGIAGYSKAMMKYRINKTIEQITLIAGNIKAFFASQKDFSDLGTETAPNIAVIKKAKLVPDEMWDGDNIVDPFGNIVNIHSSSCNSNGDDMPLYSIGFTDLPEEVFIELSMTDWTPLGIEEFQLCGSDFERVYGAFNDGAVNIDRVMSECEGISKSDMSFSFRR